MSKLYWTTGEVAIKMDMTESHIRYLTKVFGMEIKRSNVLSRREFTAKDIAKLERINYLLKVRRFTIEGAKIEMNGN